VSTSFAAISTPASSPTPTDSSRTHPRQAPLHAPSQDCSLVLTPLALEACYRSRITALHR
jgi:hypothetical protein